MTKYLIDHTGDYLQDAARACNLNRPIGMRLEIVAREGMVIVRGCIDGVHKTWDEEGETWEIIATAKANPLIPIIDRVIFRLQRQAERLVPAGGNLQKGDHVGQKERGVSGN